MIYIITALLAEASVLIETYQLQKSKDTLFPIYKNKDIVLIVSGIGKINAASATTFLLLKYTPTKDDKLFNIGICTSTQEKIKLGSLHMIKKIVDIATTNVFHLSQGEQALSCVDKALDSSKGIKTPLADMESVAVYLCAKKFISSDAIMIVKIVSDKTDSAIPKASDINALFQKHKDTIGDLLYA